VLQDTLALAFRHCPQWLGSVGDFLNRGSIELRAGDDPHPLGCTHSGQGGLFGRSCFCRNAIVGEALHCYPGPLLDRMRMLSISAWLGFVLVGVSIYDTELTADIVQFC